MKRFSSDRSHDFNIIKNSGEKNNSDFKDEQNSSIVNNYNDINKNNEVGLIKGGQMSGEFNGICCLYGGIDYRKSYILQTGDLPTDKMV